MKTKKVIISGGGTGGHVFPAISIADALRKEIPDVEILFVGALGKLEMEKVPAAGYEIVGLPVAGFQRKLTFKNVTFFFKLAKSLLMAKRVVKRFKPDAVVGVGGYASGPVLKMANKQGIPTLLQEQNSYAGVTNKLLAKAAAKICVAYENMDKYFPAQKIILTGNPIRKNLFQEEISKEEAFAHFNLEPNKKTILILGGSLGARSINEGVIEKIDDLGKSDVQVLWQTGKYYFEAAKGIWEKSKYKNIKPVAFINRMDYAYTIADTIISRAGAGTISELCVVGKPVILVPSPNVAEDHQTKNANALVSKNAALMVKDAETTENLINDALSLLNNTSELESLSKNIKEMALPDSAEVIAKEVIKLF